MGDPKLGGDKALPPIELGFFPWLNDALTAVKAANSDATFFDATATKKPNNQRGFDTAARFKIQDGGMMVTVTGDDKSSFKISDPDENIAGAGAIGSIDKIANDLFKTVAGNKKLQTYNNFRLFRPDPSVLKAKKLADQPYYDFFDDKKNRLGLIGASDGKDYMGVK